MDYLLDSDPGRALALAATLAGDGQETEHLFHPIDEWLDTDEAAARRWVEEREGPGRDHARARLLGHDAARDPGAASWARNVGDDDTRRTMIAEVLGVWRGQDPEAAEAAALGLPEEDRPPGDR